MSIILPPDSQQELSKEYMKEEILKCSQNVEYFLETVGRIRVENEGLVKFTLYDYQREILDEIVNNRFLAILKSRQIGVSTVISGFIAWYLLFHRQRHIFIMATKREKASISFEMVKTFVENVPEWMKLFKVVKNNTMRYELSNGSWVKCQATSLDAGVGEAASMFFIDEAALIEKLRDHWVGLFPTISTGGRCVMASTPRGVGNKFWEICQAGSRKAANGVWLPGGNEFRVLEYAWQRRFSKEWFEREKIGKSPREIAQEYECRFLESGNTFLDTAEFEILKNSISEPFERREDNNLWVWKRPEVGIKYLLGVDIAKGDSGDFSACHVLDIERCEVVAEYKGKIKTNDFAHLLHRLGTEYNTALIVPESNSLGDSVIQHLLEFNYTNMYYQIKGRYISHWDGINNAHARAGLFTSATSRSLMLQNLEEYIRLKKVILHSQRLYTEFTTFIWRNEKPEAIRGMNDDLVMSLAISLYVKDRVFRDITRKMLTVDQLASGYGVSRQAFETSEAQQQNQQRNMLDQLAMFIVKR